MCQRTWQELGLTGLRLEINSLGTAQERQNYREDLRAYFAANQALLDQDSIRRLDRNPLRIMDSKAPSMQSLIAAAPSLQDYLGDDSRSHFDRLRRLLDTLGVDHIVNPRLVRGLDYYSHTVFEWVTDQLGAQGTVCAGGRYDGLIELQGGRPWPGIGFAMGLERLVELLRSSAETPPLSPHVYMVTAGESSIVEGLKLAESLRRNVAGIRIQVNIGGGSFKAQFKRADRSGADLALILGEDEVRQATVSVKHLRTDAEQQQVKLQDLQQWLSSWLAAA
jgi:histidyl-tRNA synthetase